MCDGVRNDQINSERNSAWPTFKKKRRGNLVSPSLEVFDVGRGGGIRFGDEEEEKARGIRVMDEKSKEDRQMSWMLFQLAKVVKRICGDKIRTDMDFT